MELIWEAEKRIGIMAIKHSTGGFFTIPDGHSLLAADQVQRMLVWIENEFQKDCRQHPGILMPKADGQREFVTRNISRTLSYVTQALLLEGILLRSYKNTVTSFKTVDPSIMLNTTKLAMRKKEIAEIKLFRDKVAAHTVFSAPKDGDNIAQELKSLIDLISTSHDGTNTNTFGLGAMSLMVGGEKPKHEPQAIINKMHPLISQHLKQWILMFEEASNIIRPQLPKTIGDIKYTLPLE